MEPRIIVGDVKEPRGSYENPKVHNTRKRSHFYLSINILFAIATITFCLYVLLQYDIIGSYSMKVLVKVPVETVDLKTIAATYMPELGRTKAVQKIMRANRFHSSDLILLKGDVLRVPMYRKSRIPPADLLLVTVKK
jgi:hypothetical protein